MLRDIHNICACAPASHVECALEAELGGDGGAGAQRHRRRGGVRHHAEAERGALEEAESDTG